MIKKAKVNAMLSTNQARLASFLIIVFMRNSMLLELKMALAAARRGNEPLTGLLCWSANGPVLSCVFYSAVNEPPAEIFF